MDDMNLPTLDVTGLENNVSEPSTPKSQNQTTSNIKRWASVVKAQKNIQHLFESDMCVKQLGEEGVEITSEILDSSFENHKVFIDSNKHYYTCNVCSIELDSVLNLSNHLKTRNHEDNVISFFKEKLPLCLHNTMEFISFCGLGLCCNLCQFKIDTSYNNAYETIVSIIAHNASLVHASRKVNYGTHNEAHNLLSSLAAVNPEIKMNAHYIDKKMNPQFKCNLCSKDILYDENVESLTQNFISHLRSDEHITNKRTVATLKLFGGNGVCEKAGFTMSDGNISCSNQQLDADFNQLLSHVDGVKHAKNMLCKLESTSNQESKTKSQENKKDEPEIPESCNSKKSEINQKEKCLQLNTKHDPIPRLHDLLHSLPFKTNCTDYTLENDRGFVTCLICNCEVPPSTYNLQTHILGTNHRQNEKLKKISKTEEFSNQNLPHVTLPKNHDTEITQKKLSNPFTLPVITFSSPTLPCPEDKISSFLRKIPKTIRVCRCHQKVNLSSSVVNNLYENVFMRNSLVKENEKVLIKNVDGRHSYCKLCKVLIPLSLDRDILEGNIVLHVDGKKHKINFSHHSPNNKFSKTMKSLGSLFLTDVNQYPVAGSTSCHEEMYDNNSKVQHKFTVSKRTERKGIFDEEVAHDLPKMIEKSFAEEENNSECLEYENSKKFFEKFSIVESNNKLSVSQTSDILKFKAETDEAVLIRRKKQIDYGKNTEGYARYCQMVPRHSRSLQQPVTPPRRLKCSRRAWDGMIRAWRRQLHNWDPSSNTALR